MTRTVISTKDAPQAIGPYSQAIRAGGFLFTAGQIPLDPATGEIVEGDVTVQATRALDNLRAVLAARAQLQDIPATFLGVCSVTYIGGKNMLKRDFR